MRMPFIRLHRFQRPDVWDSCGTLRIGRLPECEVHIEDLSISRQHATIRYEGDRWLLADRGSTNGTFLNRVRLGDSEQALTQGNFVQFGEVVLVVELIDFVTEAGWFSPQADPSQLLALLRQPPLSSMLPAIESAINHLVLSKTQEHNRQYLWSPANPRPKAILGLDEQPGTTDELTDIRRFVIHEAIRNPFHSFGGLKTDILMWNNQAIVKLAQAIWETSDFALLPVLADALEEAGCDEQDLLIHCRQRTQHLRCCWALRAVLGGDNDHHV
jgi:hypothetical protein